MVWLQTRESECEGAERAWDRVINQGESIPIVRNWYDLDRLLIDYFEEQTGTPMDPERLTNLVNNIQGMVAVLPASAPR